MTSPFWQVVLEVGGVMCLIAGGYLLLLLRIWPRVFLRRYPENIRQAVEPLSPRERSIGFAVSLPFIVALLAFPTWAGSRIAIDSNSGFGDIYWASYATWMIFNIFDWLVLDELVIGLGRPSWLVLPGTAHIPLTFDHSEHAIAFAKGSLGGAVLSFLIAITLISLR